MESGAKRRHSPTLPAHFDIFASGQHDTCATHWTRLAPLSCALIINSCRALNNCRLRLAIWHPRARATISLAGRPRARLRKTIKSRAPQRVASLQPPRVALHSPNRLKFCPTFSSRSSALMVVVMQLQMQILVSIMTH